MNSKTWLPLDRVVRAVHAKARRRGFDATLSSTEEILREGFEEIRRLLERGEKVLVPGFGIFRPTTRKARVVRNPQTRELMKLSKTKSYALRATRRSK